MSLDYPRSPLGGRLAREIMVDDDAERTLLPPTKLADSMLHEAG
jgi:hypothetical protein